MMVSDSFGKVSLIFRLISESRTPWFRDWKKSELSLLNLKAFQLEAVQAQIIETSSFKSRAANNF